MRYFGPFVDVRALRVTMDELIQAFPLRSCSKHKFNYQQRIERPCLLYRHRQVLGSVRRSRSTPRATRNSSQSWARFFDGDVRQLRDLLQRQMHEASEQPALRGGRQGPRRPRGARARRQRAQNVVLDDHSNLDVLAVASDGGRAAVVRFRVRFGRVIGRSVHLVDRSMDEDDEEILENVLTDIYTGRRVGARRSSLVPSEELDDAARSPSTWSRCAGARSRSCVAQRGKRRRVVELAAQRRAEP